MAPFCSTRLSGRFHACFAANHDVLLARTNQIFQGKLAMARYSKDQIFAAINSDPKLLEKLETLISDPQVGSIIEAISGNAGLRDCISQLLEIPRSEDAALREADVAEMRVIESMRALGHATLEQWASNQAKSAEVRGRADTPGAHRDSKDKR